MADVWQARNKHNYEPIYRPELGGQGKRPESSVTTVPAELKAPGYRVGEAGP